MPEGFIQVAPDSTGKLIRTEQNIIGGQTVHQQVVTLADPSGTPLLSGYIPKTLAISRMPTTAVPLAASSVVLAQTPTSAQITAGIGALPWLTGFTVTAGGAAAPRAWQCDRQRSSWGGA